MMSGEETDTGEEHITAAFCSLDGGGKRVRGKQSIGEMEQEFLDALSAYYYEGRAAMSDAEFELLKEELQWAGSKVVVLDSDEQRFLEAVRSWGTGKPIMTDEAFDQLRTALRVKGSIVAAAGPRCSLRSKRMYADATPDNLRMAALRTPAAALVAGAVLGADKIAGFDVSTVIPFLPSYDSDLIVLALLVAASYAAAGPITNLVLRDGVILKGNCPCCNTENRSYFGGVFSVASSSGLNKVVCEDCGADLTFDGSKRVIVVERTPDDKALDEQVKASEKAALAAKKAAAKNN